MSALPSDRYQTPVGAWVLAGNDASARSSKQDLRLAAPQLVDVRCECGSPNCTGEIRLPLEEYEEARVHPRHFLIKEGHEVGETVRVVGYGTGYVVVAKYPQGEFSLRGPR
jgi:hypothetical protein